MIPWLKFFLVFLKFFRKRCSRVNARDCFWLLDYILSITIQGHFLDVTENFDCCILNNFLGPPQTRQWLIKTYAPHYWNYLINETANDSFLAYMRNFRHSMNLFWPSVMVDKRKCLKAIKRCRVNYKVLFFYVMKLSFVTLDQSHFK